MSRPKTQYAFDADDYVFDKLINMDEAELRSEYSKLRSIARKRLERLGKSEFADSQTYLTYKDKFPSLQSGKIRKGNVSQIAKKLADVKLFLGLQTGSIKGQKEYQQKEIAALHKVGYTWINKGNFKQFIDYMEFNRSLSESEMYDSDEVQELAKVAEEKGLRFSQVKKDFEYWMEHIDELKDAPALKAGERRSASKWMELIGDTPF